METHVCPNKIMCFAVVPSSKQCYNPFQWAGHVQTMEKCDRHERTGQWTEQNKPLNLCVCVSLSLSLSVCVCTYY